MANLQIEIGAVTKGLDKGLSDAQKKLESFSKSAISVGKKLSLAVTAPLVGLAAISIANFEKQAQAVGQIEAALLSTGNAAGKTSEELQKTASDLQKISTFGDEEILQGVTSQLLTFTNIAGDAFDRTQLAALNLATRLGGDLQGAAIQLGKALNDPVANLSALSRSGIQFSKDQKELINSLVETNRLADAQTIILDELEKQYGGSAEAAAKLGTGPLKQLSNQFGDLLEDVGKIIVEGLAPLIEKVSKVITFFQGLSDSTKKTIVIIAALAAAIGPLLLAVGSLGLALPIIASGAAAISAAFTPTVALIIAVTAVVGGLVLVAKAVRESWGTIAAFFSQVWDKVKLVFLDGVSSILESVNKFTSIIGLDFTDTIDKLKSEADDLFVKLAFTPEVKIGDVFADIGSSIKNTFTGIKDNITSSMSSAKESIEETQKVLSGLGGGLDASSRTQETAVGPAASLFGKLDTSNVGITIPPINDESKNQFLNSLEKFNNDASNILTSGVANSIGDFAFTLGEALGSGANVVNAIGATLLSGIAQIANQLGQAAIAIGVSMIAIKKSFSNPFTAIAAGVALIALAGVISSQVPKITQGKGGGSGGITSGAGQSFEGTGTNNALVDSFGALEITGQSKIQGTDIIISYEKAQRANGR